MSGGQRILKLGIFTDVHGDLCALHKVLNTLEHARADTLVCLGDLVVHGQRPNEVVELVRALAIPTVGGNHDHGAVHYGCDPDLQFFNPKSELHTALTQLRLSPENRAFLNALPETLAPHTQVHCVHASYRDRYGLLYSSAVVDEVLQDASVPVTLSGHTHRTRIHVLCADGEAWEVDPWAAGGTSFTYELDWDQEKYILNCGNTSQLLYDRLPSVCGLLDTGNQTITWKRVY